MNKKFNLNSNTKKSIIKYLIEFLIVAFGVFLGIYMNERDSNKRINDNKDKTIKNIISELKNNNKLLENSIKYHELINVNLNSLLKTIPKETFKQPIFENSKFKYTYIKGWTGSGFAGFDDTAFEVSKMSGTLENMDIELIQEISKIYNKLKFQSNFQNSIINRMANISSNSSTYDAIGNIAIITGDNLNMEKNLSKQLEQSIEKIKTLHNTNYK